MTSSLEDSFNDTITGDVPEINVFNENVYLLISLVLVSMFHCIVERDQMLRLSLFHRHVVQGDGLDARS